MPIRIYMVRHGRAAAGFDAARDPGLDDEGHRQAEAMADRLAPKGPLPILVSPLRRTRETAAPLERRWGVAATIEPRIAEIPSPISDLTARSRWLREIAPRRWPELDPGSRQWRETVLATLAGIGTSTVLVSHFIPINVALGHVEGDDRIVCFQPDNCSCTIFEVEDGRLRLAEPGAEAPTRVL